MIQCWVIVCIVSHVELKAIMGNYIVSEHNGKLHNEESEV